jgi:hypothetical protein
VAVQQLAQCGAVGELQLGIGVPDEVDVAVVAQELEIAGVVFGAFA